MSEIPMSTINLAAGKPHGRSRRGAGTRQTGLNNMLFWLLLSLVALVPLPLASVRPFFWGMAAVYLGLLGAFYAISLARLGEDFRSTPRFGILCAAGFGLFYLALVVQVLPIGGMFGGFLVIDAPGVTLRSEQISIAPGMTVLTLIRQLAYGLFFFLMLQVLANENRRMLLLDALLVVVAVYAAYGMISLQSGDTILGMPKWAYLGSATSTFVNRNSFATFLSLGAVITAVRYAGILVVRSRQHADDGRIRGTASALLLYALAFAMLGLALLATQSRMGLFAGAVGSALGFCLMLTKAQGRIRFLGLAVASALLLGGAAFLIAGDQMLDRVVLLANDSQIRSNFYAQIIELIAQRPFTGWGGGSFEQAFQLVHRPPVNVDFTWSLGHNTYLTLWSEMGIVAGSIPILIVAFLAVMMIGRFLRASGGSNVIAHLATALGAVAVVGVHSLADFSIEIPANAVLFLAILACGTSALQAVKQRT